MTHQQFTIGVIGHVDHGKTSLVKALTGIDTDRLEEEKQRGLSIVLGFAYLEAGQTTIDLIDVPGHERFIRTMIAGATGIDAILLVIAANEGIKPQTREHFTITQLLGIKQGLIVITKSDLVDKDQLYSIIKQTNEFIRDTFLHNSPVYCVSIIDGSGLTKLSNVLINMVEKTSSRMVGDNFYLPLDRVFTVSGFGTVGTGTLRNGKIKRGDEIEIMPLGVKASVRELQVHNKSVAEALPGQRVAVNLRGIKRDQLNHGHTLITPGSIQPTTSIYAMLRVLDDITRVPKRSEPVRLLFGTTEVIAKLRILEDKPIKAGVNLLIQLRTQKTVIAGTGEHFIIRTCSPIETIGGGEFLDNSESLSKISKNVLLTHLHNLERGNTVTRVREFIHAANSHGIKLTKLTERSITTKAELISILDKTDVVVIDNNIAIERTAFESLGQKVLKLLEDFHKAEPFQPGYRLEHFKLLLLADSKTAIVDHLFKELTNRNKIIIDGNYIRLSGFSLEDNISDSDRKLIDSIERIFINSGISTPTIEEVIKSDPAKKCAYQYLKDNGKLISLRDTKSKKLFIFHSVTLEDIKQKIIKEFPPPKKFTVSEIRSLLDSTRKYVLPILEYFDRNQLTIRQGDYRTVLLHPQINNIDT